MHLLVQWLQSILAAEIDHLLQEDEILEGGDRNS